jgi:hypothetical protein
MVVLLHTHACAKLGLDDPVCVCISTAASVISLVAFSLVAWRIGR